MNLIVILLMWLFFASIVGVGLAKAMHLHKKMPIEKVFSKYFHHR